MTDLPIWTALQTLLSQHPWVYGVLGLLVLMALLAPVRLGRHAWNVKLADKRLAVLTRITHPQQQFGYCRKVDPYVWEEMILTALSRLGHRIKRNRRYSGDGGIDGKVTIQGQRYFVQAKRYQGHINAAHVAAFAKICQRHRVKGLFVHTGRTGNLSRQHSGPSVDIVSGQRLLDMLTGKGFIPRC